MSPRQTLQFVKNFFIKFHLASHFGLYLREGIQIFKIFFYSFIDLGLLFDFSENESCSTLLAKAGFFYAQNLSRKPRIFYNLKMCEKVLLNINTLKQKWIS